MSTEVTAPSPVSRTGERTSEQRIARLFGLTGDAWMRHANPISVWTRFSCLSLFALAIWSREWIGWLSVVAVAGGSRVDGRQSAVVRRAVVDEELGVEGGVRRAHLGRSQAGRDP